MKRMIIAYSLAILAALSPVFRVQAQVPESIWLTTSTTAYKTNETVVVTVNASSVTPIQGFTFQIRYDPACLRPVNASSPLPGMNGLPLPQLTGLVDGSYASTTPQAVNGALAEVRFTALQGCQTGLYLESAALAVRNAEGFAAPLASMLIGERNVSLNIDREAVESQSRPPDTGSILPLDPPKSGNGYLGWFIGIGIAIAILVLLGLFGIYKAMKTGSGNHVKRAKSPGRVALYIKEGPQAGKRYPLNKLPCLIGRDPQSDICINDPNVIGRHAKIYAERNGYYLMDLGGGTFINNHLVKGNAVVLHQGDVVGLGKNALFVFG
jgi:hypothetical protein